MQLIKGLFIAAVLCVASVNAGNSQQQQEQNIKQHEVASNSASSASGDPADSPDQDVQQGFNVHKVNFASSDPNEEEGEEKDSANYVPLVAAVGACACMGVLGAVYLKRRSEEEKLGGEIFTIDDKNSVL